MTFREDCKDCQWFKESTNEHSEAAQLHQMLHVMENEAKTGEYPRVDELLIGEIRVNLQIHHDEGGDWLYLGDPTGKNRFSIVISKPDSEQNPHKKKIGIYVKDYAEIMLVKMSK